MPPVTTPSEDARNWLASWTMSQRTRRRWNPKSSPERCRSLCLMNMSLSWKFELSEPLRSNRSMIVIWRSVERHDGSINSTHRRMYKIRIMYETCWKVVCHPDHSSVGIRESQTDKENLAQIVDYFRTRKELTTYFQLKSAPNDDALIFEEAEKVMNHEILGA